MQERLSRFEEWARKKRELLTSVMEHAGLKRLVEPDFTVRAADSRRRRCPYVDGSRLYMR